MQFTEEKLVVDFDGSVTMVASPIEEPAASTAVSHTPGTPELHATLSAFTDATQAAVDTDGAADSDYLDLTLLKKKKKKALKVDDADEAEEDAGGEEAAGEEAGLDLVCRCSAPPTVHGGC